jgi:alcohol dehydrogenase class IV
MPAPIASARIVFSPLPAAHFGAGAIGALPGIVRGAGGRAVALVTDETLAGTPVVAAATAALASDGLATAMFAGVHANPTTGHVAAGAAEAAALAAGGAAAILAAAQELAAAWPLAAA